MTMLVCFQNATKKVAKTGNCVPPDFNREQLLGLTTTAVAHKASDRDDTFHFGASARSRVRKEKSRVQTIAAAVTSSHTLGGEKRLSFVADLTTRKLAPHFRCNRTTQSSPTCPAPTASQHNTPHYQAGLIFKPRASQRFSRRLASAVTWDRIRGAFD